jgi:DNA replication protein DnaC
MARAFEEQLGLTASSSLSFEERFGIVVDRELAWRDTRRLERLLKAAKLKNPQACIEDIEYRQSRGIDQRMIATLAGCDWVRHAQNLILTGPTGAGKTWIACTFGQQACRQGFSVFYVRVGRLFEELKIAHGAGSFSRRLAQLAQVEVLLLDDWGLQDLDQGACNDLLEVLDDRVGTRSAVITDARGRDSRPSCSSSSQTSAQRRIDAEVEHKARHQPSNVIAPAIIT